MTNNYNLKNAQILIIDDEPGHIEIIVEYLNDNGYGNITTTTKSEEAIKLLNQRSFDLVLLDLIMPHTSGFKLIEINKQRITKNTIGPIIILTAKKDSKTQLKALKSPGVRDFLPKPFTKDELIVRIENLLELYFTQKQLKKNNLHLDKLVKERTKELEEQNHELVSRNSQIAQNQFDLMRRLSIAAEKRDNETGMHIIRVSQYSKILALSIGINEHKAEALVHTAPMHDIGKLGIPDNILLKPGKLNEKERTTMNTHPLIGGEILANAPSELVNIGRTIALTHHEKWDGTGYPKSLAGKTIPIEGRIVALADVFDALTSERSYKKAWKTEDALSLIKNEQYKHFDPNLVTAFIRIFPQILKIKHTNQDK